MPVFCGSTLRGWIWAAGWVLVCCSPELLLLLSWYGNSKASANDGVISWVSTGIRFSTGIKFGPFWWDKCDGWDGWDTTGSTAWSVISPKLSYSKLTELTFQLYELLVLQIQTINDNLFNASHTQTLESRFLKIVPPPCGFVCNFYIS